MTEADKLQTLRDHQTWRMGGDGPMTPPKDLTAAIEYAIRCVEDMQLLEEWIYCGDVDPVTIVRRVRALMEAK